jgi:hypothetical protein
MKKISSVANEQQGLSLNIEELSVEKVQPILSVMDKIIELLGAVGKLIDKIKDTYYEYKRNRVIENIDKLQELIIHRTLLNGLRKLGLGEEWLKLVVNEKDNFVWLKDIDGIYVAINNKMFNELNFERYSQILGTDAKTASTFVTDDNKYKVALDSHGSTDNLVLKDGYTIVNMTKLSDLVDDDATEGTEHLKIFKYAIKNREGEIIAIFGIGKVVTEEYIGLETIEDPEGKIIDLLTIVDKKEHN